MSTRRTSQRILDDAVRNQVYLERLKSQLVKDAMATVSTVEGMITSTLKDLEVDRLDELTRNQLERLLADLRKKQLELYATENGRLTEEWRNLAGYSAEREARMLDSWVTAIAKESPDLVVPSATQAWKAVAARPIRASGTLLDGFMSDLSQSAARRVEGAVRNGYAEGKTVGEVVRQIRGTRAANYKDGITNASRREVETVVRTATQHVANTARAATWEANSDLVQGYVWVSTLDGSTTSTCRSLDGQRFALGKGPLPPIHPNCRSTTVADLGPKFDFLKQGATRSSENGPVDASLSYYDWLKKQDQDFIKDAIGATRAKLLVDGGLTSNEFARLNLGRNFEPLTLDEMRKLDAAAFKRAGL